MTLGLQVVYLKQWITAPIVMEIAYGAALVAVVLGVVKRRPGSVALGSVILAYPFLNSLLTLSGSVNEGRYTLFLLPWLALAMARAAEHRIARITVLVGVVAVSAIGIRSLRGQTSPYAPDIHVPTSMVSLEHSLSQHQVHYVWANYWIAYRLTFETREQVIAASAMDARYEPYQTIVSAATHPAFVFLSASRDNRAFAHRMGSSHIRYADWTVGQTWTVYIPAVRLQPTVIIASYV
jgi:hypothetical protein